MDNIYAVFTIIFGGVFGIGFIILGIIMWKSKPSNKIPKPSPRLNNNYTPPKQ